MAKSIYRVHWGVKEGVYTDFEDLSRERAKDKAERFLSGYCRGEGWMELVDELDVAPVEKTKVIPMRPGTRIIPCGTLPSRYVESPDGVRSPVETALDEAMAGMMPTLKSA